MPAQATSVRIAESPAAWRLEMFVHYENANAPSTCVIPNFGLDAH